MESLINALELAASERPELLPWLLATSRQGPGAGAHLARAWGVRPIDLRHAAVAAAHGLDRLEARRAGWRKAADVIPGDPNIAALFDFAEARRGRVLDNAGRLARLETISRKLGQALEDARQLQKIRAFIDGPPPAVEVDVFAFLRGNPLSDRPRRE